MGLEEIKLNDKIRNVLSRRGITELTEIQQKTFPSAANGHDLIGVSQTGSGKTLGFLLPIIHQTLLSDKPFHSLILAPTRELAYQISKDLSFFEELGIRQTLLSGGDDFNQQANSLSKKPHIIIGTPGRIVKHIQKTKSFHIERIRKLIFDEADRFFEQDFIEDLGIISKKLVKKNQTLMFTATLTGQCKSLANIFMRSPKIYSPSGTGMEVPTTLTDSFIFVPEKYKLTTLFNYLSERRDTPTIVFTRLCSTSQKIGLVLAKLGISCKYLHGKIPQVKRIETVKQFRDGEFTVLIATDLASRGLDIPHVELVMNYDLPDNSRGYIHRIGRTARAGRDGQAISLVTQYDVERLQKLEYGLKRRLLDMKYENISKYEEVKQAYLVVNMEFNLDKTFKA